METVSLQSPQYLLREAFVSSSAAFDAAPVTAETLHKEFVAWGDAPVVLQRTEIGRSDSEFRFHNAEQFFRSAEDGIITERVDLLYRIGIVLQLGLSAWLIHVGFTDDWCRRHIGLRIAKSLGYANATGLDYHDPDTNLLAAMLTPYGKWRSPTAWEPRDDGPVSAAEMIAMTRRLLDHVQRATGHTCPH